MNEPPRRRCNGCSGSGFHKVATGPCWTCDTCHPGLGPDTWTDRHQATDPSSFKSMHRTSMHTNSESTAPDPARLTIEEHVRRILYLGTDQAGAACSTAGDLLAASNYLNKLLKDSGAGAPAIQPEPSYRELQSAPRSRLAKGWRKTSRGPKGITTWSHRLLQGQYTPAEKEEIIGLTTE
jgi:hypothetical protein